MKPCLALLVLVAACSKDNPYYCENNPDHNCTLDAAGTDVDSTMACTGDETCGGTTPACNLATNQCVQCTDTNATACGGTAPVCSANACSGCAMNADCVSGACMPDGSCAAPDAVLFATTGTPAGTTCAATDKCSLEAAITAADATKQVIVLDAGTYATSGSVAIGKQVTLLARGAVISKGGGLDGPVFDVTTGGKLTVYYAELKNGLGDSLGNGITCMGGSVTVKFAAIHNNDAAAISATSCTLSVDRSKIYLNPAGGIELKGTSSPVFMITNNFIYENGNNSLSQFGGVRIGLSTIMSGSTLEFNTIVNNYSIGSTSYSGGVVCNVSGFTAPNNILVHNSYGGSTNASDANYFGSCTYPTSIKQESLTELAFGSTSGSYDLRIGATSIAKDAAMTASTVAVDFEGDDRPQNGVKDCGADEHK